MVGGSGSLTKAGTGTLTLGAISTYSGPTAIAGGTLKLGYVPSLGSGGSEGVFTNVPETAGYVLAYELQIGTNQNLSGGVPYTVDNSASIVDGSFRRVGYYMELQKSGGPLQWVYASFDASDLSTQASKLGVPIASAGEFYHYNDGSLGSVTITNMNVLSNVPGIVTGTNIGTGLVQFWPSGYGNGNAYGVPNAIAGQWGLADDGANTSQGYGSMKIGNYGTAAQQMLLSFNNWNGGTYDVGLGNGSVSGYNNDYTFAGNAGNYVVKNLEIVVGNPGTGLPAGSPVTIAKGATLDLDGEMQQIASLSDYRPGSGGGSIINSHSGAGSVLTLSPTGGSTTFSGMIQGGGTLGAISLVMNGSGTQVLAGSNTYTGGTTVNQGVLTYLTRTAQPKSGTTTVAAGATLGLGVGTSSNLYGAADLDSLFAGTILSVNNDPNSNVGIDTSAGNFTYAPNFPPTTMGLTKLGANTLTLTGSNTNYSGPTAINGGTLQLGDGTAGHDVSLSGNVVDNAVLVYNLQGSQTYSGAISGSGSLTKTGIGTLTLGNNNAYSGPTVITGGTLQLLSGGMPANGLVGFWKLNEGAGATAFDTSGVATPANGTLGSNASWVPVVANPGGGPNPPFATAVQINGNAPGVTMGAIAAFGSSTAAQFGSARTISGWVELTPNANNPGDWHDLFGFIGQEYSNGTFFDMESGNGGNFVTHTYGGDTTIAPIVTGQWVYLTASADANGYVTVYLNGQQEGAAWQPQGGALKTLDHFGIELSRGGWAENVSDVSVYNRVLTPAEVGQLYNWQGPNPLPTGTTVRLGASKGTPTLDLNGVNQQVAALADNGIYTNGTVINSSTGAAAVLTLSPTGGSTTFSGTIVGGGAWARLAS